MKVYTKALLAACLCAPLYTLGAAKPTTKTPPVQAPISRIDEIAREWCTHVAPVMPKKPEAPLTAEQIEERDGALAFEQQQFEDNFYAKDPAPGTMFSPYPPDEKKK